MLLKELREKEFAAVVFDSPGQSWLKRRETYSCSNIHLPPSYH